MLNFENLKSMDVSKISRPIQLLQSLLIALILLVGVTFTAAGVIGIVWIKIALYFAGILYVPLFIWVFFMLLTKYRIELGDDTLFFDYATNTKKRKLDVLSEKIMEDMKSIYLSMSYQIEELGVKQKYIIDQLEGNVPEKREGIILSDNMLSVKEERIERRQKIIGWAEVSISLNENLTNYHKIREKLEGENIYINEIFGIKTNRKDKIRDFEDFIIIFGKNIPFENFKKVIILLNEFGIKKISYVTEIIYEKRIIIGSYYYDKKRVRNFEELVQHKLLDGAVTADKFYSFFAM